MYWCISQPSVLLNFSLRFDFKSLNLAQKKLTSNWLFYKLR